MPMRTSTAGPEEKSTRHVDKSARSAYLCRPHLGKITHLMYAIVEIAGHQYKVQKDQQVFVNRLPEEEGAKVSFDRVLLVEHAGDIKVGAPAVSGATVSAVVENHLKGDKVLIFKKKRRKGHQKLNGFRASLTAIRITDIKA